MRPALPFACLLAGVGAAGCAGDAAETTAPQAFGDVVDIVTFETESMRIAHPDIWAPIRVSEREIRVLANPADPAASQYALVVTATPHAELADGIIDGDTYARWFLDSLAASGTTRDLVVMTSGMWRRAAG